MTQEIAEQYLIRTVDGEDYKFPDNSFVESISPDDLDVKLVEPHYGCAGLVINGIEFSFAWEPPGLHVTIEEGETTADEIDSILHAILRKLGLMTGQSGIYLEL